MINKIAHLADIHLPITTTRHDEYRKVFKTLFSQLKKDKPDRIVIVGDLFHNYLDMQGEQIVLAKEFLNGLAKIAPVVITRGNHDISKKNLQRTDSIEAIVNVINNKKITYLNETGFHDDENITWAVWKHGEKDNSPWETKEGKNYDTLDKVVIDLFHNPIGGGISPMGYEFNSKNIVGVKDFHGHYSFFGDLHLKQYFANKTKAYSSSLIEQNFSEGDGNFHGYLLWDISTGDVEERSVNNDFAYNTVTVNQFTDFDDLDLDVENVKPEMKIRILWKTFPATRTKENERKVIEHLKDAYSKYKILAISHKNEFIVEDKIDVTEEQISDITDDNVQEEIFRNYLSEIGTPDDIIEGVIDIDKEITSRLSVEELTSIQWDVIKFKATNFMSYKDIDIDWRSMDGLYQITGLNTAGKTTIMKLISYLLYGKTLETEKRVKYGDSRYVNNNVSDDFCEGEIVIKANEEYFGIKKKTIVKRTKDGEIKGASTGIKYYKLVTPDDVLSDDNDIDNLTEEEKKDSQKLIDKTIGTYENFKRVVMTTSDTLNDILSNDAAEFIDALLRDSGLDIFDKKLDVYKDYVKEVFKERISCDVEKSKENIEQLKLDIENINNEINNIEANEIPKVDASIKKGNEFVEETIKKLHKIDDDVYNFDVDSANTKISEYLKEIEILEDKRVRLEESISKLVSTFDSSKLDMLEQHKDLYKTQIYDLKSENKQYESNVIITKNNISVINGDIVRLKDSGAKLKERAVELQKSKTCPTCGQLMTQEHQDHINNEINKLKSEMLELANKIKEKEVEIPALEETIAGYELNQKENDDKVAELSVKSEDVLKEIGVLVNQRNDFEKRNRLIVDRDNIPTQKEVYQLKIDNLKKSIDIYEKSLSEIEENRTTTKYIEQSKIKLASLQEQRDELTDDVFQYKTQKSQKENEISLLEETIDKFKIQERKDLIMNTYKKCTHRNGIPTQLLINYAIPKINNELNKLLEDVGFSVWLDTSNDIRLKLSYNTENDAIDAISGSGKERTFASVCLKFALNQINAKSKPTMFLLDEVMGKLTEDSIGEFVEILHMISDRVNKLLIIEHNHEVDPTYLINVTRGEDNNSVLTIE